LPAAAAAFGDNRTTETQSIQHFIT